MAVSQSASSGSLCPSVMGLALISCEHLSASIRICLPHFTVWELSDSNPIWVEDIFLSVCELNGLYATLLNLLDSAVGEDALLVSILFSPVPPRCASRSGPTCGNALILVKKKNHQNSRTIFSQCAILVLLLLRPSKNHSKVKKQFVDD